MNIMKYAQHAIDKGASCRNCNEPVNASDIRYYNHDAGWNVDGFQKLQWLYFECRKCKYQTSFAKLGIPRPRESLPN